jgi:hypothetical protein
LTSPRDVAPKMIGDKWYAEAADDIPVRRDVVVGERGRCREAESKMRTLKRRTGW